MPGFLFEHPQTQEEKEHAEYGESYPIEQPRQAVPYIMGPKHWKDCPVCETWNARIKEEFLSRGLWGDKVEQKEYDRNKNPYFCFIQKIKEIINYIFRVLFNWLREKLEEKDGS